MRLVRWSAVSLILVVCAVVIFWPRLATCQQLALGVYRAASYIETEDGFEADLVPIKAKKTDVIDVMLDMAFGKPDPNANCPATGDSLRVLIKNKEVITMVGITDREQCLYLFIVPAREGQGRRTFLFRTQPLREGPPPVNA